MNDDTNDPIRRWRREIERQNEEFRAAMRGLAALGDTPQAMPGDFVERLDALAGPTSTFSPATRA